eukprot:403365932
MLKEPLIENTPNSRKNSKNKQSKVVDLEKAQPFKVISQDNDQHYQIAKWIMLTTYGILIVLMIYYSVKDADMHQTRQENERIKAQQEKMLESQLNSSLVLVSRKFEHQMTLFIEDDYIIAKLGQDDKLYNQAYWDENSQQIKVTYNQQQFDTYIGIDSKHLINPSQSKVSQDEDKDSSQSMNLKDEQCVYQLWMEYLGIGMVKEDSFKDKNSDSNKSMFINSDSKCEQNTNQQSPIITICDSSKDAKNTIKIAYKLQNSKQQDYKVVPVLDIKQVQKTKDNEAVLIITNQNELLLFKLKN